MPKLKCISAVSYDSANVCVLMYTYLCTCVLDCTISEVFVSIIRCVSLGLDVSTETHAVYIQTIFCKWSQMYNIQTQTDCCAPEIATINMRRVIQFRSTWRCISENKNARSHAMHMITNGSIAHFTALSYGKMIALLMYISSHEPLSWYFSYTRD